MRRFYNDQKLNRYIQPRIKKYYNYTHQKLVAEEVLTRNKIEKLSKDINNIEKDIKETRDILDKLRNLQSQLQFKNSQEEVNTKNQIKVKNNFTYPKEPFNPIFNIRNLVCLIISIVGVMSLTDRFGDGAPIFFITFFIVSRIIAGWVLKEEDRKIEAEYNKEIRKYEEQINAQFKPSEKYKKNIIQIKKIETNINKGETTLKENYNDLRSFKFEIVLLKKILFEFKRFKKRASEREKTAKINAFEKKNRTGSQNIKEKLIKAVRIKSQWSCPYCNRKSNIDYAEADHIHPVNKGGLTTYQNMVLICKNCNSKKTNLMLRVFCKKQNFNFDNVCLRLEKLGKDV